MTPELQDYSLPRTGRLPLAFRGEVLAAASGEDLVDERGRNPRWHDLELYRTAGGRYVLYVRYRTEWKEEVGFDDALVLEGPGDVWDAVRGLDPTQHVRGYPRGIERWEKKQGVILEDIRARFDQCVSDLFSQLGGEFTERID